MTIGWKALVPGRVAITTPRKPTPIAIIRSPADSFAEQRSSQQSHEDRGEERDGRRFRRAATAAARARRKQSNQAAAASATPAARAFATPNGGRAHGRATAIRDQPGPGIAGPDDLARGNLWPSHLEDVSRPVKHIMAPHMSAMARMRIRRSSAADADGGPGASRGATWRRRGSNHLALDSNDLRLLAHDAVVSVCSSASRIEASVVPCVIRTTGTTPRRPLLSGRASA